MSDLFGNHIVGFPTRRLNYFDSKGRKTIKQLLVEHAGRRLSYIWSFSVRRSSKRNMAVVPLERLSLSKLITAQPCSIGRDQKMCHKQKFHGKKEKVTLAHGMPTLMYR